MKNNKDKIDAYHKKYKEENVEKIVIGRKKHYAKNRDTILQKKSEYYQDNKEVIDAKKKEYIKNNIDKVRVRRKKYYNNNAEMIVQKNKEHYQKNKERIKINQKKYAKRHSDIYSKTPDRIAARKIRDRTRWHFPIDGQTCAHCSEPATERHHTTKPMQVNKFKYFCHDCHVDEENRLRAEKLKLKLNIKLKQTVGGPYA